MAPPSSCYLYQAELDIYSASEKGEGGERNQVKESDTSTVKSGLPQTPKFAP
jgi:hypothetical protein